MNIFDLFWTKKNNILVLGSNGMLGYDVFNGLKKSSEYRYSSVGNVIGLDVQDGMDFTKEHTLGNFFNSSIKFDYCINCIAHTNTSSSQNTREGLIDSYKLNALIPKYIAESCKFYHVKLIHVSTDYVFSEFSSSAAFNENNSPCLIRNLGEEFPVNVYGTHKLIGDLFIKNIMNEKNYAILRTSWLYGNHNRKSFIHKFLKNVKNSILNNKDIEVTSNEFSIPTSTDYVFRSIQEVINYNRRGVLNSVCYSPEIAISRADWAQKILDLLSDDFIVNGIKLNTVKIKGVERKTYQPVYSAMRSSFDFGFDWQYFLEEFFKNNKNDLLEYFNSIS